MIDFCIKMPHVYINKQYSFLNTYFLEILQYMYANKGLRNIMKNLLQEPFFFRNFVTTASK